MYLRWAPRSTPSSKWIVNISENPYSKWSKHTMCNWSYKPLYLLRVKWSPAHLPWQLSPAEIIQDEDEITPKSRASWNNPSYSCIFCRPFIGAYLSLVTYNWVLGGTTLNLLKISKLGIVGVWFGVWFGGGQQFFGKTLLTLGQLCLGKNIIPNESKWWFDGELPWYKVKMTLNKSR